MRRFSVGMVGVVMGCGAIAARAEAPVCCASDDHGIRAKSVSTELGKVGPGAENLSRLPGWQAFVFTRNGVRYVEVADAVGAPRAAFTIVNGGVLTLPIGSDVVQQVLFAPAPVAVVFEDAGVVVGIASQADGTTVWQVYVK